MNRDLLNQLPADEQPIASQLDSLKKDMQLSPSFQWELENQLMDTAKAKRQPGQGWPAKIMAPMAWAVLAVCAVFLLSWTVRSLAPASPPVGGTSDPEVPFTSGVRQGDICSGPLALAHGFDVFLTNQDKTGFVRLDQQKTIGEWRFFAWSPVDGQLAVVGNTTGQGNIYLTDFNKQLEYVLSSSELGYLMGVDWSRDGEQLILWSIEDNSIIYLVSTDGTGLVEKSLGMQTFETPQFAPDDKSIVFFGAASSSGLFEVTLDGSQIRMISPRLEDESSFAWSPDGARLAYFEVDRNMGEVHLVAEEMATGSKAVLAALPVPRGSGSSLPESANLSWSPDGKSLVFEFGRTEMDRAIYLAYADGSGLVKLAEAAHAPAISADGRCLAYISNKQVLVMDLSGTSLTSPAAEPVLLADLPAGRATSDFRLDKLQWRPGTIPESGQP